MLKDVTESDLAELSGSTDLRLRLREAGPEYERVGEALLRRARDRKVSAETLDRVLDLLGGKNE